MTKQEKLPFAWRFRSASYKRASRVIRVFLVILLILFRGWPSAVSVKKKKLEAHALDYSLDDDSHWFSNSGLV